MIEYFSALLTGIITIIIILIGSIQYTFADSPSFVRQEIMDGKIIDWNRTRLCSNQSIRNQSISDQNITTSDIKSVSYSSDGSFLNATFWLTSRGDKASFDEIPINSEPRYLIYLDVDTNLESGENGSDYAIGLRWINSTQSWYREFLEFSEAGQQRSIIFERIENISNSTFLDEQKRSVQLSLDLGRINFPNKYNTAFQIEDSYQCIIDSTSWLPVPPPEFFFYTFPISLTVRPGDERLVELFVNSTTNLQPFRNVSASLSYSNETLDNSEIIPPNIVPKNASFPSHGLMNSKLHIKISPHATGNKVYTLPLHAHIFFPSLQRQSSSEFGFNITSYFTITVLPPKNFNDYSQDLANWISPINSIWTFIAAVGVVLVPFIIRQYSKKQNKKRDDKNLDRKTD